MFSLGIDISDVDWDKMILTHFLAFFHSFQPYLMVFGKLSQLS